MLPRNRITPLSVDRSHRRIEFVASRRAALAWGTWLIIAVALLLSCSLPVPLRGLLASVLLGWGGAEIRRFVLLGGRRAIRALEWFDSEPVEYHLIVGPRARRLPAEPSGVHRYGAGLWILAFRTGEGGFDLLVDAASQDPRVLRPLSRRLFPEGGGQGTVTGAGPRGTVTIQPKV